MKKEMKVKEFLNEYRPLINMTGLASKANMHKDQVHIYAAGIRNASPKTAARLQKALDDIIDELKQIELK